MKTFYAFKNLDNPDMAELCIYDEIGFWGLNAKDFQAQLKACKAKNLAIHINSPGGDVIDGFAIYNMLKAFPGKKNVIVDGIAASIASIIAMAGDTITMPENAFMFIHNPLVNGTGGNADDLRKVADDLDKMKESLLSIYEARTGSDRAKITKMMNEETLLTAKEARTLGFCDEVIAEQKMAAKWDASNYLPEEVCAALKNKDFPPSTSPGGQNNKEKHNMPTLEEVQAEVASLKAENSTLKNSAESAKKQAHQEAVNTVKEQEKTRKTGILQIRDKYNKDGDLDSIAATALAGEVTPDQFKDQVMEVINNRGTKTAIKKSGNGDQDDGFEAKYKNAKTAEERRKLVRENRAEARKLARG